MKNPTLSLVTCGRNDDYGGNFRWRLETTLNYTADQADKIGRINNLEFLVVDWGSEVPLHNVIPLNEQARKITRFIIVPRLKAEKFNMGSDLAGTLALNTGFRRSRGEYIAQTGGDVLYDTENLEKIFCLIEGRSSSRFPQDQSLFFIRLKNIPYEFTSRSHDIPTIEKFICENGRTLFMEPLIPFLFGNAGALLMHRNLWLECRGLDEKLVHWGWSDIDLKLRITMKYSAVDTGKEGIHVFHLSHRSPSGFVHPNMNRHVFNPFIVNDPDWGLAREHLEEFPETPIPVITEPAPPFPSGRFATNYRWNHFINLLRFTLLHPSRENLGIAYAFVIWLLEDCPDGNIAKQLYTFLKNVKRNVS